MLIPDNIHPKNSIYYNGAIILEILYKKRKINLLDLYIELKKIKDITFPVFLLCIDWLYLSEIAILKDGSVELCS